MPWEIPSYTGSSTTTQAVKAIRFLTSMPRKTSGDRRQDHFISINATIEVDLLGQCNSESIDGAQFSGTGGQLDFVRGAFNSKGGKSIIAFYSTAHDGAISRIVPRLRAGSIVTVPRMDTHLLATEYGIINLKGKSTRDRALAIIGIAHPRFRNDLLREAENMFLL